MTKNKPTEIEGGSNDTLPTISREQEMLAIMDDIIRAYKKLITFDEPETQKLIREMTKCFITAGSIVRLLKRRKKV